MHKFPKVSGKVFLAPMAGITDVAFRLLCKENDAGLVYTEMVSANALVMNSKATESLLASVKKEKPVMAQLFGQDVDNIVKAARIICENYDFDGIDINCGCPATSIIKEGAGSALLGKPEKLGEIIRKTVKASSIPVTAKIRIGVTQRKIVAVEIARIIEDNGASAIAVHGRYATQGYSGKANWDYIKDVKDAVGIPVIGNGDIDSPEGAKRMMDTTGCDYVMVGRAAMGNPTLIRQCDEYLKSGKYVKAGPNDRMMQLMKYLAYAKKYDIRMAAIKVQSMQFCKGMSGAAKMRGMMNDAKDIDAIKGIFEGLRR